MCLVFFYSIFLIFLVYYEKSLYSYENENENVPCILYTVRVGRVRSEEDQPTTSAN